MLRATLHQDSDSFQRLEEPWKELVPSSRSATPFQTFEWNHTWWTHYAKTRRPLLITVQEGGDLVGLMPFTISRGPWRTLRAMASGASDYLHPLARQGHENAVAEAISEVLPGLEGVDLIDLHQIREPSPEVPPFPQFPVGKTVHQATCLVLRLPSTFDSYLAMLGKSLRYDVRKLDKELFKSGEARISEVSSEDLEAGLDVFFDTHKKRWRKRGLPGAFVGRAVRFQREWASKACANGWLWLSILHYKERPVGAIYAMRLGPTCYYYQAGFDPAASSISPGSLLVGHTIRRAIEEGVQCFDFLRGDEPYKRRWMPQHEYKNLRFITPGKGILGKIGQAWNDAGSRVENRVRARLEGRGLLSSKG